MPAEYARGDDAGPARARLDPVNLRNRLLRVLPVALAVCLVLWLTSQNNDDDCGTVGECLGDAFDDMAAIGVALLLGPVALWALRVPRVLVHSGALTLALASLWYGAAELRLVLAPGTGPEAPVLLPVALAVGVLSACAATYVAGPGGSWQARTAILVAAPLLATAAHVVADRVQLAAEADAIDRVGVTLYAPVVAGEGPDHAYTHDDEVRLGYTIELDDRLTFVDVVISVEPLDDTPMRSRVQVEREGAVLTADYDPASLDLATVRDALESAPEVDADDLVS